MAELAQAAPEIVVVGLGPAGAELLTVEALAALEDISHRYLRTARHPIVSDLRDRGLGFETFDAVYEQAETLDAAYEAIVDLLVGAAAQQGRVLYGVPGSPFVAEATVHRLRARTDTATRVVDGLSFIEPAFGALGVDAGEAPTALVDGRRLDEALVAVAGSRQPPALLVAQVDTALVLSDVKLALLQAYEPGHDVALLMALRTPDERVVWSPLAQVDHGQRDPGHLACLWVPAPDPGRGLPFEVGLRHVQAGRAFADLVALQDRLYSPGGCPWDAEQTHGSLARHLLEETYEVLEVLDDFPDGAPSADPGSEHYAHLAEELGDLVMQVVFHARLAEDVAAFDAETVVNGIVAKLVARHPHVFGSTRADSAAAVVAGWELGKREEKGRESTTEAIPRALPALSRAAKLVSRTSSAGLGWGPPDQVAGHVYDLVARVRSGPDVATGLGELAFAIAALAQLQGVDPEAALRVAVRTWAARIRDAEVEGDLEHRMAWELQT